MICSYVTSSFNNPLAGMAFVSAIVVGHWSSKKSYFQQKPELELGNTIHYKESNVAMEEKTENED